MLNRTPNNTSNTINAYRKKRQQKGSYLMYGAIALVVIGLGLLIVWLTRPDQPIGRMLATDTPTATITSTPTSTSTPTITPTVTETPTLTLTATPSEPFDYTLQEGDTLPALAERFNLGPDGVLLLLDYNPDIMANDGLYFVGQTLRIPPPGTARATATPVPADLPRGRQVDYQVLPGDTLAGIAAKFNSLADEIAKANNIEDANSLRVGDNLKIPVNLVTATPTLPPTSTPVTPSPVGGQPTSTATSAPVAGASTGTASCAVQENPQFVSQLEQLINAERTKVALPALKVNAQLSAAAKAHATDMLCNNYLSHIGLNGSTPQDRVRNAGYNASLVVEELYALHPSLGGNPQAAMTWWMGNSASKADLLNSTTTEFGIAYISSEESLLGGYFVVVSAKP